MQRLVKRLILTATAKAAVNGYLMTTIKLTSWQKEEQVQKRESANGQVLSKPKDLMITGMVAVQLRTSNDLDMAVSKAKFAI